MDQYDPCPGGNNKKIKFCCADLTAELDKIGRMIDGDQRVACLDHIARMEAKFQDRACILAIKAMLESELNQADKARETAGRFIARHPDNPVALAEVALAAMQDGNAVAAVAYVQRALSCIEQSVPERLYEAILALGQVLIRAGHTWAGRAHLFFHADIAPEQDNRAATLLGRINAEPNVPLYYKDDPPLCECPADAPYASQFVTIVQTAAAGQWFAAGDQLAALIGRVGDVPHLWQTLAGFRCYVADAAGAAVAYRKYASLDVSLDDAVDAELRAQILEPEVDDQTIELVDVVFPIADFDALLPRLAADRRVPRMPVDVTQFAREGQPPPKDVFWILDRPLVETAAGMSRDQVPRILGELYLFGRETDRPARAEVSVARVHRPAAEAILFDLAGDAVERGSSEEVVGRLPEADVALSWKWLFPQDATPTQRRDMTIEEYREAVLNRWCNLKLRRLGDRTPLEASRDPQYRVPLLALVLRLEVTHNVSSIPPFDYNQLRTALGLPTSDDIDPDQLDLKRVSLMRLSRVRSEKLSDDDLIALFGQALVHHIPAAVTRFGLEIVGRESLRERISQATVYGHLSQFAADADDGLVYLEKAQQAAIAKNQSPAPYYLRELAVRISIGDAEGLQRLLRLLQNHSHEQGVAMATYQLLARFGLVDPNQMSQMPPTAGPRSSVERLDISATAPPPAAGNIWTPDGAHAARPASSEKSSLWMPD